MSPHGVPKRWIYLLDPIKHQEELWFDGVREAVISLDVPKEYREQYWSGLVLWGGLDGWHYWNAAYATHPVGALPTPQEDET